MSDSDSKSGDRLSRRKLFAGASGVGVVAVAASLATGLASRGPAPTQSAPTPEKGGGYRLSDHVKHYYKTTQT